MIWKGDNIDKRHGVWSATKSFTSTVLGLLIADGKCTLDTHVADVLPELKTTPHVDRPNKEVAIGEGLRPPPKPLTEGLLRFLRPSVGSTTRLS